MLVTALAAALHEEPRRPRAIPDEIHAMVPLQPALAPTSPVPTELGNDFALILLELPVGERTGRPSGCAR